MDYSLIGWITLFSTILTIIIFFYSPPDPRKKNIVILSLLILGAIAVFSPRQPEPPRPQPPTGEHADKQDRIRMENAFLGTWEDQDSHDVKWTFKRNNGFDSRNIDYYGYEVIKNGEDWLLALENNQGKNIYTIIIQPNTHRFEIRNAGEERKFKKL